MKSEGLVNFKIRLDTINPLQMLQYNQFGFFGGIGDAVLYAMWDEMPGPSISQERVK